MLLLHVHEGKLLLTAAGTRGVAAASFELMQPIVRDLQDPARIDQAVAGSQVTVAADA